MSETKKEPTEANELSKKIYHHMSGIGENEFENFVGELVKIGVLSESSDKKPEFQMSFKTEEKEMISLIYNCLENVNELDNNGSTNKTEDKWNYIPINLVVDNKCESIAKFLIDEQILDDPDKKFIKSNSIKNDANDVEKYITAVRALLNNDNPELKPDDEEDVIIFMLKRGEKGNITLYSAIENKWKKVVKYLIENTKIIKRKKREIILDVFSDYENYKEIADLMLDFFIEKNQNLQKELFYLAAKNGYVELLKKLIIEYKVNLNTKFNNETILQIAVENGQTKIIEFLVNNSKYSLLEEVDYIGNIFKNNHSTHIVYIINKMLCLAAEQGKFKPLIKLIDNYKVNPNTKFDNNKTILHIAAENKQKNIVIYLAGNHKNLVLEKTKDGKTALQLAYEKFGVCELTEFLNNKTESALKSNVRKMAKDRILFKIKIDKINFINSSNKSVVDSIQLIYKPSVLVPYFPIKVNDQEGFISDHIIYSSKRNKMNLEESIKHNILLTNLENVLKNCKNKMEITESGNMLHNCSETERYKKRLGDFAKIDSKITIAGITYGVAITLGKIKNTTNDYELYEMVIKNNFDGKGGYRLRY